MLHCLLSICYVANDVTNDKAIVSKVLGLAGEKLQAYQTTYSFADFHMRAATRNYDATQSGGCSLLVFERFASVGVAMKFLADLAEFDKQATEAGTMFDLASIFVWPRLFGEWLPCVLGVRSLTWQSVVAKAEAMAVHKWAWTHTNEEGDVVKNMSSESIALNLQLLMLARLPGTVQGSEVAGTLPLAEDLRFADCIFENMGGFGQPPFVLAAQAAEHVGLTGDAVRYLRAALVRHANPVKQHYAHCLLGQLQS
jgi:hypothetical protein